jgi:phosphosulfolactate synthase
MTLADKHDLLRRAAESFVVLSEVGSKEPDNALTPEQWTDEIAGDLEAGARWVITEGRESGTVGLYRSDGTVREDIVAAAVRGGGGVDRLLFEAPRKDQQAWLIRAFGPDVNLANIAWEEALALETLRLGLRADTCDATRQWLPV